MSGNYMHYNWDDVGKIMSYVVMKCPLNCKETFRTKAVLRQHLQKDHTALEYEKFLTEAAIRSALPHNWRIND